MTLYIDDIPWETAAFHRCAEWDSQLLPGDMATLLATKTIAVCPRGKHDLSLCDGFERQWRQEAGRVLTSITQAEGVCLLWAAGPMEAENLLRVFPHIVGHGETRTRYHVPSVTCDSLIGYCSSWVAFEFCRPSFDDLMSDEDVDLEFTRLYGLVLSEGQLVQVLTRPFWSIGLRWVLENNALAIASHRHFEGLDVAGQRDLVERAVSQVELL